MARLAGLDIAIIDPRTAFATPDRFPEMAAKPLPDRFAGCPWGCYYIEVAAG